MASITPDLGSLRALLLSHMDTHPNVVGFCDSLVRDEETGNFVIEIYLARPRPQNTADWPLYIAGTPVQARVTGRPRLSVNPGDPPSDQPGSAGSPLRAGDWIGTEDHAGTLGCIVVDRDDATKWYALTCAHIFDEGTHVQLSAFSPAPPSSGGPPERCRAGKVTSMVRTSRLDAACVQMTVPAISDIAYIRHVGRAAGAVEGRPVQKYGAFSYCTNGTVHRNSTTQQVISRGAASSRISGVFTILPEKDIFSADGDSGSVVVDREDRTPVGLVFATSTGSDLSGASWNFTYAFSIQDVLDALNVTIAAPGLRYTP